MAQRASLAQVLAVQPRLLLLDEPFGSLDALTRLGLQEMLHQLWVELEFGVVMVTHDVDEAVYLADRVIVLTPRPGRVLADLRVSLPHPRIRRQRCCIVGRSLESQPRDAGLSVCQNRPRRGPPRRGAFGGRGGTVGP
jgi:ABC-type nitrate/sulfonate/bicarbonate transport system ATPase subunit